MADYYSLYSPIAISAAQMYGVPQELFLWQIGQESGWNPAAKNPNSTASGIAQFIKGTAEWFKIDPFDPVQSLYAAAKYDKMLYDKYGSWDKVLHYYGTTQNAPQKVIDSANKILQSIGATPISTGNVCDQYKGDLAAWLNCETNRMSKKFLNITPGGEPGTLNKETGLTENSWGVGETLKTLTNPDTWQRVGLVVIGGIVLVFVFVGLYKK